MAAEDGPCSCAVLAFARGQEVARLKRRADDLEGVITLSRKYMKLNNINTEHVADYILERGYCPRCCASAGLHEVGCGGAAPVGEEVKVARASPVDTEKDVEPVVSHVVTPGGTHGTRNPWVMHVGAADATSEGAASATGAQCAAKAADQVGQDVPVVANVPAGKAWGIVGWRNYTDGAAFGRELGKLVGRLGRPTAVISGGASGADFLAEQWATHNGIPLTVHKPAALETSAYHARNDKIVADCDVLVAFLSTQSKGTRYTINRARQMGRVVIVVNVD